MYFQAEKLSFNETSFLTPLNNKTVNYWKYQWILYRYTDHMKYWKFIYLEKVIISPTIFAWETLSHLKVSQILFSHI